MEISATVSFWIGIVGIIVGLIGLGIAIYQWAVIDESKKQLVKIQYTLAGVGTLALAKVQAWNNQASLLPKLETNEDLAMLRVHSNARDDLMEISSLVSALEGSIDPESSATTTLLEKAINQGKLNNELQKIGLENPTIQKSKTPEKDH